VGALRVDPQGDQTEEAIEQEDSDKHGMYEKMSVELIQSEIRGHMQWHKECGEVGGKDVRIKMRLT